MPKAQMHFEVDHELKAHWKAFFALLPRKSETRILTELMRNFLEKAKAEYKAEEAVQEIENNPKNIVAVAGTPWTSNKEVYNDPGALEVDQSGDREGVHDESGVEIPGSDAGVSSEE